MRNFWILLQIPDILVVQKVQEERSVYNSGENISLYAWVMPLCIAMHFRKLIPITTRSLGICLLILSFHHCNALADMKILRTHFCLLVKPLTNIARIANAAQCHSKLLGNIIFSVCFWPKIRANYVVIGETLYWCFSIKKYCTLKMLSNVTFLSDH